MLDIITQSRLEPEDFHRKVEWLIEGFIAKHLITLIYAAGGSGKSWLAYALAKYAAGHGMDVMYLDYDNPVNILGQRGLEEKLINQYSNLYYVSGSRSDYNGEAMIQGVHDEAKNSDLSNTLIILDSLRDFIDVRSDVKALNGMSLLKGLRDREATVIALSHANKDGNNYEGSNNLRNSLDNMLHLRKIEEGSDELIYLIEVEKDRAGAKESAWKLDTNRIVLYSMDVAEAKLTTEDKDFIEGVKAVLKENPGINKKDLLSELGYDKRDKTSNNRLDKYSGIHWVGKKKSNTYTYQLIGAE